MRLIHLHRSLFNRIKNNTPLIQLNLVIILNIGDMGLDYHEHT